MDSIKISDSEAVRAGLENMLEHYMGANAYVHPYVQIETALLIVEIAKKAQDEDHWFPLGKWATIQAIQDRIDYEINKMMYPKAKT